MRVGILTGTGTYALASEPPREVATAYGTVLVTVLTRGSVEVLHISRHEAGHARLSNHVNHRANIAALRELGADCALGVTVCGAVDPTVPLGSLLAFDDLHFLQNRLSDGSLCTLHDEPARPGRGHWIFDEPFSAGVRRALLDASNEAGVPARDGGCYGHVDGPRFNSRAEIRSLALAGVTAVSQTAGPETVLCGEAALPYALLGYATDYANGVSSEPTPVPELLRLIRASTETFTAVLDRALEKLATTDIEAPGTIYSFD
ncbi:MAG: MTAP family purine nucleoside phosphorylase [Myxococcales bacterium]